MILNIPTIMDSVQIDNWKSGEYLKEFTGTHQCGKWKIRIFFNFYNKIQIEVLGYNNISFGEFKLDKGVFGNGKCYPTMTFYNSLSYNIHGFNSSDTLCSRVNLSNTREFIITLIESIEDSWNKIREFLQK